MRLVDMERLCVVTVRMDPALAGRLRQVAAASGESVSSLLRRYVAKGMECDERR